MQQAPKEHPVSMRRRLLLALGLPAWVFFGFLVASLLVGLVLALLEQMNVIHSATDSAVLNATIAALVYVVTLVIVIGLPWKVRGIRTTKEELGLTRLPNWSDIAFAPIAFIIYMILAAVLLAAVSGAFPGFNADEAQDVGFEGIGQRYEYILAFVTLVIIAPIAEEVLVRGYLYGKLRKVTSVVVALLMSSLLFSAMHMQWNVAINVLPLGIVMVLLRETTGSIWSGVVLHMIKNGLAFYLLFINPSFLTGLGG